MAATGDRTPPCSCTVCSMRMPRSRSARNPSASRTVRNVPGTCNGSRSHGHHHRRYRSGSAAAPQPSTAGAPTANIRWKRGSRTGPSQTAGRGTRPDRPSWRWCPLPHPPRSADSHTASTSAAGCCRWVPPSTFPGLPLNRDPVMPTPQGVCLRAARTAVQGASNFQAGSELRDCPPQ